MAHNAGGNESRKNVNHFEDGFGRRRVRHKRGSSFTPVSRSATPPTSSPASQAFLQAQDSGINTNAVASSSKDGGSMFQSATNFDIHGGNFLTVTVNANLTKDRRIPQSDSDLKEADEFHDEWHSNEMVRKGKGKEKQVIKDETNESDHDVTMWPPIPKNQSKPLRRSCDIYYQHIGVKRRGSPLWIPEPNKKLSKSYQRKGMTIGDVGIITDSGGFDFLFNICLPRGHPINPTQLPENFVPFSVESADIREYSEFKGESYLASASIKKSQHSGDSSGLNFVASASEGAILTMPVGLNSEDLGNIFWIRKYAAANAEHWYKYINYVRGREAKNGDVRLVIGYDKTTAWGIATFSNLTAQTDSFHLKFRPVEQSSVGRIYEWEHSGMAEVRSGPHAREIEALRKDDPEQCGAEYENQCLFVRTLNITLRDEIWKKLESGLAELAVDDDPGYTSYFDPSSQFSPTGSSIHPSQTATPGGSHDKSQQFSSLPMALTGHPSGSINEMLLKLHPNSRVAITDDKDWISVINEDDFVLPPAEEIYSRIMASFNVCEEEDMVFLEKVENDLGSRKPPVIRRVVGVKQEIGLDGSKEDVQTGSNSPFHERVTATHTASEKPTRPIRTPRANIPRTYTPLFGGAYHVLQSPSNARAYGSDYTITTHPPVEDPLSTWPAQANLYHHDTDTPLNFQTTGSQRLPPSPVHSANLFDDFYIGSYEEASNSPESTLTPYSTQFRASSSLSQLYPIHSDLTLSPLYSASPRFSTPSLPGSPTQLFMASPTLSDLNLPLPDVQATTGNPEKPRFTHREQLQKFREAMALPGTTGIGPFVPQQMYKPHTTSDRKRYVEEVMLEGPLYFIFEQQQHGISLKDALHSRTKKLLDRDQVVFEGRGPSVSIRLEWPGYRQWSRQIPTKDFRSPPQPLTLGKLAKSVAKCVQRFILDRKHLPMEEDADQRWKIGDGPDDIKFDDLVLVSIHHVSLGSWQPHLRLVRPFPARDGRSQGHSLTILPTPMTSSNAHPR